GDTSGDGDGDDECKSDSDCNSGYYCISGSCEYEVWCGAPLPHHPGSVAGDPVHPACQPQPECYTSAECGPDQYCGYDRCYDAEVLSACPSMDLLEIPLPDEITGPILDLQFVDVDGDQQDELLVLLADDLILI